jgi:hypothetical protein
VQLAGFSVVTEELNEEPDIPTAATLESATQFARRQFDPFRTSPHPPSDSNSQEKRYEQRTKRRFACHVAQDAQWHSGLSGCFNRIPRSATRIFQSIKRFSRGRFRLDFGIQTIERG